MTELTAIAEDSDVLPPGIYRATFVGIECPEEPGLYGPYLGWPFDVLTDDGPVRVTARTSRPERYTKSTKARCHYEAIHGRPVEKGDTMVFSKLVGRPCLLRLEVKSTDKGDFNRVVEVMPARTPKHVAAPTAPPPADDDFLFGDEPDSE